MTRTRSGAKGSATTGQAEAAAAARWAVKQGFSPEERHRMIAEAAYYRAAQRGFTAGDPVADWLAAEADIDRQLGRSG